MMNLVTVLREDGHKRIYRLPDDVVVERGTRVTVEGRFGKMSGLTVNFSQIMTDEQIAAIEHIYGIENGGKYFRILEIFTPTALEYPDEPEAEDDAEDEEVEE